MSGDLDTLSEFFQISDLDVRVISGAPSPLMLTARTSQVDHLALIRAAVVERGVVLIRGLEPVDGSGAAALAGQLLPGEKGFETGEHPEVEDLAGIYRPVPFAPEQTLLWHHENSFNASYPRFLMFFCEEPAASGGATTVVDSRIIHQQMPGAVIISLARDGVEYRRVCDGRSGRRWQRLYGTDDPAVAQQRAAGRGESLVTDGDWAEINAVRDAFLGSEHGPVWFAQVLHWHPAALPAELRELVRRGRVPVFRDCRTGSGGSIDDSVIDELTGIYRSHEYAISWRPGDVLLVDNTVFAHGRHPFRGPRKHFVRMVGHEG